MTFSVLVLVAVVCTAVSGCGPKPPIPYQMLQIQDSEEAEGYDIYLYVAIPPDKKDRIYTPEQVEELLKWFDEVKYPTVNKMAVFVWKNPQAALMGNSDLLVGSLKVDRSAGIFEIRTPER